MCAREDVSEQANGAANKYCKYDNILIVKIRQRNSNMKIVIAIKDFV